eukprot:g30941.t1
MHTPCWCWPLFVELMLRVLWLPVVLQAAATISSPDGGDGGDSEFGCDGAWISHATASHVPLCSGGDRCYASESIASCGGYGTECCAPMISRCSPGATCIATLQIATCLPWAVCCAPKIETCLGLLITSLMFVIYVTALPSVRRATCCVARRCGGFRLFQQAHSIWPIVYLLLLIHTTPRFWIWMCRFALARRGRARPFAVLLEAPKAQNESSEAKEPDPGTTVEYEKLVLPSGRVSFKGIGSSDKVSLDVSFDRSRRQASTVRDRAESTRTEDSVALMERANLPPGTVELQLQGPFGAPAQRVWEFKTVMVVGAGIGVTPFVSILRSVQMRKQQQHLLYTAGFRSSNGPE